LAITCTILIAASGDTEPVPSTDKVNRMPALEMACSEVGEQSIIQSRQMKPIGWMKKQKKAGNLSSEQFNALQHMRSREEVSPKQSPASPTSKANAAVKKQKQSGAQQSKDNSEVIPASLTPSRLRKSDRGVKKQSNKDSKSTTAADDEKAATMARIKRTRQARIAKDANNQRAAGNLGINDSEQPKAMQLEQQQRLAKLKQQRRDGNVTKEQFKALKAKAEENIVNI